MKLRHVLASLTLFALAIVQPGLAQPGLAQPGSAQPGLAQPDLAQHGLAQPGSAQPGLAQPDLSSVSSSAMPEDGGLATQERTSIAKDRDTSTDAGSLDEGGPFAATVAADGTSGDSYCHICEVLRDLCFEEGIFTPRECVQQYRACVEDFCS